MADKSSETKQNLTPEENVVVTPTVENPNEEEGLSPKVEEELDEKTKQGFQRLVAKKDKELEDLRKLSEENAQKLAELERVRKEKELSELSENDRLRVERDEALSKMAQTELKSFITTSLTERNLMGNPLAQDIIKRPWLLEAIASQLPAGATWEQTIDTVKEFLPAFLDTLVPAKEVVPETTPSAEEEAPVTPMSPERNAPSEVTNPKRVWTRKEIAEITSDPDRWIKMKPVIDKALVEGRVV